ncbi:Bug family tripartite tricarboxylate transporter substrate binding protein [Azospirillum halopraeferens]|uniref:Bug family tripartite tricarboxylate transporter substrate binding protein n=1 Tax=Azospirillum halopraeferens TaxID=34010 RepID=UPI00042A20C4|nr:tripartite tricarboxylate transporter substrate binding protein [Azospirillum halopraeferens]
MRNPSLAAAAACLMLALGVSGAGADTWPAKPIKFIVGFSAGSSIDGVARILGERLSHDLGQPVVVENRTGANGMLAATAVAQAEADGYTVLISNSSSITVNPSLYRTIQYQPLKDFVPITKVVATPFILAINPGNERTKGVDDVKALMEKARANPGGLSYGSAGVGNLIHIATELLAQQAGVSMVHVPYRGAAPMEVGLLNGEIDLGFDTPAGVPQFTAGSLRALAVSGADRWPGLPDVPTMIEAGFPDFDVTFWTGVFVPKGTPEAVTNRLYDAIVAAVEHPDTRKKLELQGRPVVPKPAEFVEQIKAETAQNAAIIEKAGIVVQQ